MKLIEFSKKLMILLFLEQASTSVLAGSYSGGAALISSPFEKIIEIMTGPLLNAITVIAVIIVGYILLSGQFSKVIAFRIAIGIAILHSAVPLANYLVK